MKKAIIIIPAYNEEKNIVGVINGIKNLIPDAGNAYLCFGGDEGYERFGVTVLPWRQIGDLAMDI